MDAYLALVSKREVREYEDRAIPDDVLERILQAGRATGSSRNSQPWRFVLVTDRERLRVIAELMSRPANVTRCAAAIAVALIEPRLVLDGGRAAQNMMLAAWALGVGSCPNTPVDRPGAAAALALPDGTTVPTIISLGYPAPGQPRPPRRASADRVLSRIKRRSLAELVHRETYRG